MGWRTTRLRQLAKLSDDSSPQTDSTQTSSTRSRSKTRPPVKAPVLKTGRMPPLLSNELKIIIRPKGALNIAKIGSPPYAKPAERRPYVSIKSIEVNGVTHDVNAYETAAEDTMKRIRTSTTVSIVFSGADVPYLVCYGATLIPCSLYRKQIEISYQCGRLGHRMDFCHFPNNKICRGCAVRTTHLPIRRATQNARCAALSSHGRQIVYSSLQHTIPVSITIEATLFPDPFTLETAPMLIQIYLYSTRQLSQEVRDLKQSKTPAPTPPAEASPCSSNNAPLTPAPKKRALQEGAAGQVRSEVKDMLVSLQSTIETLHNAVESIQHALLALAQRVTNIENHPQTFPMPAPRYQPFIPSHASCRLCTFARKRITAIERSLHVRNIEHLLVELMPTRKLRSRFLILFKKALNVAGTNPLVIGRDFNLTDTVITDHTFASRLGNSTSRETTPDLRFTKNVTNTQCSNTQHYLGRDHFITAILIPRISAVTAKPPEFTWVDWDAFHKHRSADQHAERIAVIDARTRNFQSGTKAAPHTITTEAPSSAWTADWPISSRLKHPCYPIRKGDFSTGAPALK
ncbi:hypothetical protein HPB49_006962 [Dermacentor silvarum]|uniref:Uncharacterized protein n=1 Tax=Dermacentor silvarum TaxID=543639 RepID=A0ACB8DWE9_DERSI|nr:hypothetical protein HPB49_006962 [Dermacentor silvarum]